MKKSRSISLGLVPLVAASFANCGDSTPTHQRVCADQLNRVAESEQCWSPGTGSSGGVYPYHWYYMPYRGGGYPVGTALSGGSLSAPTAPGTRIAEGNIVRGGFGSTSTSVGG